jgi:hypothetical protein
MPTEITSNNEFSTQATYKETKSKDLTYFQLNFATHKLGSIFIDI